MCEEVIRVWAHKLHNIEIKIRITRHMMHSKSLAYSGLHWNEALKLWDLSWN